MTLARVQFCGGVGQDVLIHSVSKIGNESNEFACCQWQRCDWKGTDAGPDTVSLTLQCDSSMCSLGCKLSNEM